MKTKSETWFENFSTNIGLAYQRIDEEKTKTPDYQIEIDGKIIIIEVKEIRPSKEEQKSFQLLKERGYGEVLSKTPGDRVRKKIEDASAQIKAKTNGVLPSILVLYLNYENGQLADHTDSYNIRVAMYGLEQIHISVPNNTDARPYITGKSYGPKRKMTVSSNTSISAIGVLSSDKENRRLDVYHNIHASQPLDPALLTKYGIRQFRLVSQEPDNTEQWE